MREPHSLITRIKLSEYNQICMLSEPLPCVRSSSRSPLKPAGPVPIKAPLVPTIRVAFRKLRAMPQVQRERNLGRPVSILGFGSRQRVAAGIPANLVGTRSCEQRCTLHGSDSRLQMLSCTDHEARYKLRRTRAVRMSALRRGNAIHNDRQCKTYARTKQANIKILREIREIRIRPNPVVHAEDAAS